MKTTYSLLLIAAATLSANTSTIQFASNATSIDITQSNSIGDNIVIHKNSAWADPFAGSQWISYSNTGDPSSAGFSSPANGTVVSFFQHFTLAAADLSTNGIVSLFADDSAAVLLNGHVLMNEASATGNTYGTCSDTKPNCVSATTVTLVSQDLVLGANTLQFNVAQRAGSSFGLDYSGSVGSPTPEPATWFMAAGALLIGVGIRRRSFGAAKI